MRTEPCASSSSMTSSTVGRRFGSGRALGCDACSLSLSAHSVFRSEGCEWDHVSLGSREFEVTTQASFPASPTVLGQLAASCCTGVNGRCQWRPARRSRCTSPSSAVTPNRAAVLVQGDAHLNVPNPRTTRNTQQLCRGRSSPVPKARYGRSQPRQPG